MKHIVASSRNHEKGAALLLAIGVLTLLSVLGAACLLSVQLDTESASLRLMRARAAQAAEAGIQYALGDLASAADPAGAVGERRRDVPVYGPARMADGTLDLTARQTTSRAWAQVSIREVTAAEYPAGEPGAAAAARVNPAEGRLFRVDSDGTAGRLAGEKEYGRVAVRTVALVQLGPQGPRIVHQSSGPAPVRAPGA